MNLPWCKNNNLNKILWKQVLYYAGFLAQENMMCRVMSMFRYFYKTSQKYSNDYLFYSETLLFVPPTTK